MEQDRKKRNWIDNETEEDTSIRFLTTNVIWSGVAVVWRNWIWETVRTSHLIAIPREREVVWSTKNSSCVEMPLTFCVLDLFIWLNRGLNLYIKKMTIRRLSKTNIKQMGKEKWMRNILDYYVIILIYDPITYINTRYVTEQCTIIYYIMMIITYILNMIYALIWSTGNLYPRCKARFPFNRTVL